ncbi:hypothetical protein FB45DRAFT_990553 [Roridomyces roridus]|uniref:Uncharacterized protein n=1 Tax=Roridomyces roridus TaxID=1738132 RepID=A0AAD7BTV1_9AGAR|nr:hypothetical protein FB45DRAFT_990553 [Roridomyces roridus]
MLSPSLVGGVPLHKFDLPGGIVFAVAYGLLVPLLAYRLFDRRWRNILLVQLVPVPIERVVVFSLRAAIAAGTIQESNSLRSYQQANFALGYLTLANLFGKYLRSVLVNTTKPSTDGDVDDPQRRNTFRRCTDGLNLPFFAALITGLIATVHQYAPTDSASNTRTQNSRYASAAFGFLLVFLIWAILLWAQRNVSRVDERAVRLLLIMTSLLAIPPIYRLAVMNSTTPNVADLNSQSQNVLADKVTFYVLHMLPEWIVLAMACTFNLKEICQTGPWGDWRPKDETAEEREKRERKQAKRASVELEAV